jgi:hypothetical protein
MKKIFYFLIRFLLKPSCGKDKCVNFFQDETRTSHKLNSGLFAETTAQRFVFYFFYRTTFFKTNLTSHKSGTFGFAPTPKADPSATPKESLFANAPTIIRILTT